jgi:hypothetical protein
MNKKIIYILVLAMFAIAPDVFPANTSISNPTIVNFVQGIMIKKHRPANFNSEFVGSSFTASEELSDSLFSLSKEKDKSLRQFSIAGESNFSRKTSLHPKTDNNEAFKTSFSFHDDAEFSSESSLMPKNSRSEFSNMPPISLESSFANR